MAAYHTPSPLYLALTCMPGWSLWTWRRLSSRRPLSRDRSSRWAVMSWVIFAGMRGRCVAPQYRGSVNREVAHSPTVVGGPLPPPPPGPAAAITGVSSTTLPSTHPHSSSGGAA